ncbi:Holliday junction resolvase RuvX [Candidatus Chlamydia corallus]|uniref:Holliday junction resolvase RuvX n=1 Tax=Candidatus Chlamydia corallus TaxID=2038470 RepID=UPI000C2FD35C|nr:Holliday junction resolvase RuvX [Candidatus Chlamydia corallus]
MSKSSIYKAFLGVDYGKKRIGLAYAAEPLLLTLPIGSLEAGKSLKLSAEALHKIILDRKVTCVVLGNPLPMQKGLFSSLQKDISLLAEALKNISVVQIVLWDERLSSVQAERMLKQDCGLNRKQRKGKVDSLAATLILTSFLESLPKELNL